MKKMLSVLLCMLLLGSLCVGAAAEQEIAFYDVGDTIGDFTVTTCEGEEVSLYGLLGEYDAVMINFFFNNCIWCEKEFPLMEAAYERHADKIAILALSPYDDAEAITEYRDSKGLTFMMAPDPDRHDIMFQVTGFPTSFIIDKEGVICHKMSTTFAERLFDNVFDAYTADDYVSPLLDYHPESEAVSLDARTEVVSEGMRRAVFETEVAELLEMEIYCVPSGSMKMMITPKGENDFSRISLMVSDMVTGINIIPFSSIEKNGDTYEFDWAIPTDEGGNGGSNLLLYADDMNVQRLGIFCADEKAIDDMAQAYGVSWHYEE